jgi:hypothetical protein
MLFGATGKSYIYFPNQPMLAYATKFDSVVVDKPDIYNGYMDKIVITIDGLEGLRNLFGNVVTLSRQNLFELVAGDCEQTKFRTLLTLFYKRCPEFTTYVDSVILEAPQNVTRAIIFPLRTQVENFLTEQANIAKDCGGKFLMRSHDKLYYAFATRTFTDLKGVKVVND